MSAPEGEVRAFVCAYCASVGVAMRYCSVCRSTTYCSVTCQKKDWKRHQLSCGQQPESGSTEGQTPEPQANAQTGSAAATATAATSTSGQNKAISDGATTSEPTQQLTHSNENISETTPPNPQPEGLFTATNMILAGAVSITLAVAGWFAYSYLGSSEPRRGGGNNVLDKTRAARKPPQRR